MTMSKSKVARGVSIPFYLFVFELQAPASNSNRKPLVMGPISEEGAYRNVNVKGSSWCFDPFLFYSFTSTCGSDQLQSNWNEGTWCK